MKREKYTAVLQQDEEGAWLVRVPEVPGCHTYGRSLHEARLRIREALSLWVDDAHTAEVNERIRLPRSIRQVVQNGATARADARRAAQEAQQKLSSAARELVRSGYSLRDTAALLGMSHQRIAQLINRRAPDELRQDDIPKARRSIGRVR